MRALSSILLIAISTLCTQAQTLKGAITDKAGRHIPSAAVYIRELQLGIAADERGEFQTRLENGTYTLEASSLGYERKTINVEVNQAVTQVNISLETNIYSLSGVTVTNKEDPAYRVIRKAIAKAPYYLRQVKTSESEAYFKESVKINKVPAFLKNMNVDDRGRKKVKDYTGKLYIAETLEEIKFASPDKYEVNTIAFSSAAPNDFFSDKDKRINTFSIYSPHIHQWVSPLAPDALSYYKFKYEGIAKEGELWVNQIQVIPRKMNRMLAAGRIYIAEGTWNVMHVDLAVSTNGLTQHIQINYNEVLPTVFLPTSYKINVDVQVMGIDANAKSYSSVRYKNIQLDDNLTPAVTSESIPEAKSKPATAKQQKARKELKALAAKENPSNRDAFKMARRMQDIAEQQDTARRETFEIKALSSNIKVTVDTLAKSCDSLYWANVRDLPLREEERQSYAREVILDSTKNKAAGKNHKSFVFNNKIKISEKMELNVGGLPKIIPEYNFVDGLWLGESLTLNYKAAKRRQLSLTGSAHYATARRAINWKTQAAFAYAPILNGQLTLAGGNITVDFNGTSGNSRLINSAASLLFAMNYIKFYQKQFIEVKNQIEPINGMILNTGLRRETRIFLENNTTFHLFGGRPASNTPTPLILYPQPNHNATILDIQLQYTPSYYYRIVNGRKQYVKSVYPTIYASYNKAFSLGNDIAASFDNMEIGIKQDIGFNLFSSLAYNISCGTFLSSARLYFQDYKHFPTSRLPLTTLSPEYNFSLLSDYSNSTGRSWLQAHLTYRSMHLLIKNIPFLENAPFDEAIHLRTLQTQHKNYYELGYSVGLSKLARAGIFLGSNLRYLAVGLTLNTPILQYI